MTREASGARKLRELIADNDRQTAEEARVRADMLDQSMRDPDGRGVLFTRDTYTWRIVKAVLSTGVPQGTIREERQ